MFYSIKNNSYIHLGGFKPKLLERVSLEYLLEK